MLVGLIVFQPILLHVRSVSGVGGTLVESKLLEQFQSDVASKRDGGKGLLLEYGSADYCESAKDGGGFGRLLKGGVALAPDPTLKSLGGCSARYYRVRSIRMGLVAIVTR